MDKDIELCQQIIMAPVQGRHLSYEIRKYLIIFPQSLICYTLND